MGSSLIFALSVAGLALLVFGERLGLPASLASLGVTGLVAFLGLGLALTSGTTRLKTYMHTREGSSFWGGTSSGTMILVLILSDLASTQRLDGVSLLCFFGSLILCQLVVPPQLVQGIRGREDAYRMIAIVTGLAALYLVLQAWPHVLTKVTAATAWDASTARLAILLLIGLPALLGGLDGQMRLSGRFLGLFAALCLVPFAIESMHHLPTSAGGTILGTLSGDQRFQNLPAVPDFDTFMGALKPNFAALLAGALAGLVLRLTGSAMPERRHRCFAALFAVVIAEAFVGAGVLVNRYLEADMLPRLAQLPPADWPLFVFDPALQGWLKVCGEAPRDAVDIAQACGAGQALSAANLMLDPQLAFPAIAASAGWPLMLGALWNLAIPLFLVLGLGILVHGAASGISENIAFRLVHPRALRSRRLAMARATTLAIIGWLSIAPPLDERFARTLALGLVIVLTIAILSNWLRMLFSRLFRLLARRPAQPVP